jgi:tetratricopeptide (TPR) repeat protein
VSPGPGRSGLATAAALALAGALLYLPSLRAGLVWDDHEYVLADDGRHLAAALHGDLIGSASPAHGPAGYYRPVAVASYWVVHRAGGAAAHHAVSALLHGLTVGLLFLLLRARLGGAASVAAALSALAWAALPASVETVAWISARYDLLTGLLAVLFLLVPGGTGVRGAVLSGLLFLAGLLSKESFLAVAAVVLADDLAASRSARAAAPRWLAVAAAIAAWMGLRLAFHVPAPRPGPAADLPSNGLALLSSWLERVLHPWPLTVSHPFPAPGGAGALAMAGAGLALAALLALALRRRDLAPAVALLLAPLVPAALAAGRLGEAPDRYLYLPSLGLAWLAAAGLAALRDRSRGAFAAVAAALVAVTLLQAALVLRRLPDWQSDDALFAAAARVDPANPVGAPYLAVAAVRAGRVDEALSLLRRSQESHPDAGRVASVLAWIHLRQGDAPASLAQSRRAVELLPGSPEARMYLSNALHLSGDHRGEVAEAAAALRLSPSYRPARVVHALSRCEVERTAACEEELDAMERQGVVTGADALVLRIQAAVARGDASAADRLARLRQLHPRDPRIPALERAVGGAGAR